MSNIRSTADQRIAAGRTRWALGELAAKLIEAYSHWRQRTNLAELDDRLLADLGLLRSDVQPAATPPIWRHH